ncbi:hypothetical protein CANARDRAFT_30452 [[Candida] arabinofermentans NRRL YB-2248]|uniref:Transcription factor domain-containing protein n=1 Tax=[Candida] arabinofermentans NRRL YB-2248 TaxID=983967 RepID=A0A1E4STZ8_9ASCO|nr:hypothetical protein CANARDRAFT_30452 [[Candida] arabinofermentans NRRL YB-2248]
MFMDVNGFISDDYDRNSIKQENNNNDDIIENLKSNSSSSSRTHNISKDILDDAARRTLWEVYFFDTLSGTASGCSVSIISTIKMLTFYPTTIPAKIFDYKSRAECCKLVNDSIKLNVAIQANKEVQHHLVHMKAAIGNWEMKIENPDAYNAPYLVNARGIVNEGVHQSIILVNYAKIFTHRPFSYLWRPDVSKNPQCINDNNSTDESNNCQNLDKQVVDSRKIIETRKTIDSASSVIKLLLDTNPSKILERTPFYACSLAFSCLVHLSAYSWVESSLQVLAEGNQDLSILRDNISDDELDIYTEYIKLELGGIFQISRHWALSSKLIQHIKDTLIKVSPKLYRKVQTSLPESNPQQVFIKQQQRQTPTATETTPLTNNYTNTNNQANTPSFNQKDKSPLPISKTPEFTTSNSDSVNTMGELSSSSTAAYSQDDSKTSSSSAITNNNNNNNIAGAVDFNSNSRFSEIDFNVIFDENDLIAMSPSSDTGCDWVDKNVFEFGDFQLS